MSQAAMLDPVLLTGRRVACGPDTAEAAAGLAARR